MSVSLDTAFGLHCVAGNEALYHKLLGKFVDQQKNVVEDIRGALAHGDTELAHRQAHTLKGVAASLGVLAVQDSATALDAAFKEGHDVDAFLAELQIRMDEALEAISHVTGKRA